MSATNATDAMCYACGRTHSRYSKHECPRMDAVTPIGYDPPQIVTPITARAWIASGLRIMAHRIDGRKVY